MKNTPISVGIFSAIMQSERTGTNPTKPSFSMGKTKEKLAEFFMRNEEVRTLCDENKKEYPRMHQSLQSTGWQLLMYYMNNWGKSTARNYEIRITYSYLRRAFNDGCCIATLKNHINKLLRMYKGFITAKHRGGLGLKDQNTACIVLKIDPTVLQFKDERHNEAVRIGQLSAEEARRIEQETLSKQRAACGSVIAAKQAAEDKAEQRRQTPSSIASIFQSSLSDLFKRE
ncbi:hypothetical protein FHS57_005102 [Runella defluvii]|uniref:Uncharacterized protein n=1 Tax=Runella defluvii TaxID=370973 RepID=A0A7W6ET60_9BACT|nr:hypothetical protein [Runella defluvii]MBB3841081.1 hypothetical protein [Runella defluvii]